MKTPEQIASEIIKNLYGRAAFDHWWDFIPRAVQREIKQELSEIVREGNADLLAALEAQRELLSQGLDLCVRARALETMELPKDTLTKSITIPLWMEEQYQKDLAQWEAAARAALEKAAP